MMPNTPTRRSFLAGLAGAAAVPWLTARRVVAAPGKPAPSDQIRMGHIGVGRQGGGHFRGYANSDRYPSVAVCDVDAKLMARCADYCDHDLYQYKDFRRLCDRDDIDAVVVATPDHWHAITSIVAMQAGKDIYCEKPLSLTIAEGRAMVDAARRYGRVFQTGSQQRSGSNFRHACELVRSGRIGRLHTVYVSVWTPPRACYLPPEPCPPHIDWDLWLGPAPWRPFHHQLPSYSWRPYRDYSGYQNTNWGAHHVDIAQWGIGADATGPVEVAYPNPEHRGAKFTYANGVVCYMGARANAIRFIGTAGVVEVNRGHYQTWPAELKDEPIGPAEQLYRSTSHKGNWIACMRARELPVADVEIGHRTCTACHLANIAYALGRTIRWDPEHEAIVGDPEAARWVSRPKRAPWFLPSV